MYIFIFSQRSNYTVPLSKLKKTDPKAQQLGVCQGTLRSNRTATRHRPVTRTANAADAPSFVQNGQITRFGFRWFKEQVEPVD